MILFFSILFLLVISIMMFAPHRSRNKIPNNYDVAKDPAVTKIKKEDHRMKEYSIEYIQSIQKYRSLDKKSFDLVIDALLRGDRYVTLDEKLVNYCIKQNENYLGDIEFNDRRRIYNDSINIIKTTCNIDVLNGRLIDIYDYWRWEDELDNSASKPSCVTEICNIPPRPIIRAGISARINNNIVRVAKYIHADWFDKYNNLKTQKAKDNCTIKAYKQIDLCISSLIDVENKGKCIDDINNVRNKIDDSYSKLNIL